MTQLSEALNISLDNLSIWKDIAATSSLLVYNQFDAIFWTGEAAFLPILYHHLHDWCTTIAITNTKFNWLTRWEPLHHRDAFSLHVAMIGARIRSLFVSTTWPSRTTSSRIMYILSRWNMISSSVCGVMRDCYLSINISGKSNTDFKVNRKWHWQCFQSVHLEPLPMLKDRKIPTKILLD